MKRNNLLERKVSLGKQLDAVKDLIEKKGWWSYQSSCPLSDSLIIQDTIEKWGWQQLISILLQPMASPVGDYEVMIAFSKDGWFGSCPHQYRDGIPCDSCQVAPCPYPPLIKIDGPDGGLSK